MKWLAGWVGLIVMGVGVCWLCWPDAATPRPQQTAVDSQGKLSSKSDMAKSAVTGGVTPTSGAPSATLNETEAQGALSLRGRVEDEDGQPVPGATVSIDSVPPRSVVVTADGAFRFEGLVERSYQIRAHSPEGLAGTKQLRLDAETPLIELMMTSAATFEVLVVDAERRPLPEALVTVAGQPSLSATTDARGKVALKGLARGRHVITASRDGFAPARAAVFEDRAEGTRQVWLQLEAGSAVFGQVVDGAGAPIANALIRGVLPSALTPEESSVGHAVQSDAQGHWRIPALPPGTLRVSASHAQFAPSLSGELAISATGREVGPVQLVMERGARLSGQVFHASGSPAPLATIVVRAAGSAALVGVRRTMQADGGGLFMMMGLPQSELWVEAHSNGAVAQALLVDLSSGSGDVTLLLETAGVIRGVVVSSDGEPLPGAQVAAIPEDGERRVGMGESRVGSYAADVSDEIGQFQLSGLLPGTYRLRASLTHAVQTPNFWMVESMVAATGSMDVRLMVERMARLQGRVQLEDGSVPEVLSVTLSTAPPLVLQGTGGEFVLENVPPGNHVVNIDSPGVLPHRADAPQVKPGDDLDLGLIVLKPGFSLSGVVLDVDGAKVAGARVSAGPNVLGDGDGPRRSAKGAYTDDQGKFVMDGLEVGHLVIMAEHDVLGRSAPLEVNVGPGLPPVSLQLQPASALQGVVMREGRPVEGAAVVAAPGGSSTVRLAVPTQADGRYHFARLAAGPYVLTAGLRLSPTLQLAHRVSATVGASTEPVDIDTTTRGPEVTLSLASEDVKVIAVAQLQLVSGSVRATTLAELEAVVSAQSPGQSWVAVSLQGRSVVLPGVAPGPYSLCTTVIRGSLEDPGLQQRVRQNAGLAGVQCQLVDITAAPAEQYVVAAPWAVPVSGATAAGDG